MNRLIALPDHDLQTKQQIEQLRRQVASYQEEVRAGRISDSQSSYSKEVDSTHSLIIYFDARPDLAYLRLDLFKIHVFRLTRIGNAALPTSINILINGDDVTTSLGGPWSVDFEVDLTKDLALFDRRLDQILNTIEFTCSDSGILQVHQIVRVRVRRYLPLPL